VIVSELRAGETSAQPPPALSHPLARSACIPPLPAGKTPH